MTIIVSTRELTTRIPAAIQRFRAPGNFRCSRDDLDFSQSAYLRIDKGKQFPGNVFLHPGRVAGGFCIYRSLLFVHAFDEEDEGVSGYSYSISNLWFTKFHI